MCHIAILLILILFLSLTLLEINFSYFFLLFRHKWFLILSDRFVIIIKRFDAFNFNCNRGINFVWLILRLQNWKRSLFLITHHLTFIYFCFWLFIYIKFHVFIFHFLILFFKIIYFKFKLHLILWKYLHWFLFLININCISFLDFFTWFIFLEFKIWFQIDIFKTFIFLISVI